MKKFLLLGLTLFLSCSKTTNVDTDSTSIVDQLFESLNNNSFNVEACENDVIDDISVDYCVSLQISFFQSEVNIIEIGIFEEYGYGGETETDCETYLMYEVTPSEYDNRLTSNTSSVDFFKVISSTSSSITILDNYEDSLTIEIIDGSRILLSGDVEQEGGYVMNKINNPKTCN